MNSIARKLLTRVLIAAYGSIALLGHGLHWLTPEDGHHHGLEVVRCTVHGSAHHDHAHFHAHHHHRHSYHTGHDHHHHHHHDGHHHDHVAGEVCETDRDDVLGITAGGCIAHCHQCEICAFLVQARSERPQLTAAIIRQHVVGFTAAIVQLSHPPTSYGWHAPRGPPHLG